MALEDIQVCSINYLPRKSNPDKSLIPKGDYCYDINASPDSSISSVACPYWFQVKEAIHQNNGYCAVLGEGDWQSKDFSLLWDHVKRCGFNNDEVKK